MSLFLISSQLLFIRPSYSIIEFNKKHFSQSYLSPKLKDNILNNDNMPFLYINNNLKKNIYSIEHIYPISYLITDNSKNDMHNLIKTSKDLNNARGNYKYIDLEEKNYNNKNWIELDNFNYVNHNKKLFIPNNNSKGLISRAILYINDIYDVEIENIINIDTLIKWYISYPPYNDEKYHNKYINKIQNTDNKFISNYKYYRTKIYKIINN